jgi:hypothetical protein
MLTRTHTHTHILGVHVTTTTKTTTTTTSTCITITEYSMVQQTNKQPNNQTNKALTKSVSSIASSDAVLKISRTASTLLVFTACSKIILLFLKLWTNELHNWISQKEWWVSEWVSEWVVRNVWNCWRCSWKIGLNFAEDSKAHRLAALVTIPLPPPSERLSGATTIGNSTGEIRTSCCLCQYPYLITCA